MIWGPGSAETFPRLRCWRFTRKFRAITEQSSWLLRQVTEPALTHLSSPLRCSSQGLRWSAGRRIREMWGGSIVILVECPDCPVSQSLTPLSLTGRPCWTLFNFLPASSLPVQSRHRVQVMIHDWWSDPVSPSQSYQPAVSSKDPARPPWRAHATKQTFWLADTNIPITPLAGSPSSCTDGPISRKFWLSSLMMKLGMAAETDQEPPAMGNLATSGICSLAFIYYQKLVPTMIAVSPHNINNCYFLSQNNNK